MTDINRLKSLMEKVRKPLPFCPYDKRSPEYWTAPDDKPCPVCGQENTTDGPDKCRGADTRSLDELLDALPFLLAQSERTEALEAELAGVKEENAQWREGNDQLRRINVNLTQTVEEAVGRVEAQLADMVRRADAWRELVAEREQQLREAEARAQAALQHQKQANP